MIPIRTESPPCGHGNQVSMSSVVAAATTAPTASTSLSCCRTSPRERRRRSASDVAPSPIPATASTQPTNPAAIVAPLIPSMLSGLDSDANGAGIEPGSSRLGTDTSTAASQQSAAAARHRGDTSRPSGNSISDSPISAADGCDIGLSSHADVAIAGTPPGRVSP